MPYLRHSKNFAAPLDILSIHRSTPDSADPVAPSRLGDRIVFALASCTASGIL